MYKFDVYSVLNSFLILKLFTFLKMTSFYLKQLKEKRVEELAEIEKKYEISMILATRLLFLYEKKCKFSPQIMVNFLLCLDGMQVILLWWKNEKKDYSNMNSLFHRKVVLAKAILNFSAIFFEVIFVIAFY